MKTQTATDTKTSETSHHHARRIDVCEFARLKPEGSLTQVFHYRTVYQDGGLVKRDILSIEDLLKNIIQTFNGSIQAQEGTLRGEFKNPDDATACAHAITVHQARKVSVSGTEITVRI